MIRMDVVSSVEVRDGMDNRFVLRDSADGDGCVGLGYGGKVAGMKHILTITLPEGRLVVEHGGFSTAEIDGVVYEFAEDIAHDFTPRDAVALAGGRHKGLPQQDWRPLFPGVPFRSVS